MQNSICNYEEQTERCQRGGGWGMGNTGEGGAGGTGFWLWNEEVAGLRDAV